MSEAILNPTLTSDAPDGLTADALRAQEWAGEPFLHPGEDPAEALAPGTARRAALDEALAEIDGGRRSPSSGWKVRFGLLLGLERVLSSKPPATAAGTELRKHQIDALAGMLTELIAANQRQAEDQNGNGNGRRPELESRRTPRRRTSSSRPTRRPRPTTRPEFTGEDPGAVRRYRFRHPTASGKTIAAAGFVEAARTLGILILTHRRLLVSQFQRDLTTEGYGERFTDAIERGQTAAAREPDHDPDLRLVRPPRRLDLARRLPARDLRRGPHGARREDERGDPQLLGADLHRHDRDRAADREAGLRRLPRLGRRPAARPTPPAAA